MNIQLRAAGRTVATIAIAALAPFLVVGLFQLDSETLFYLFLCSIVAWVIWVIYSINLNQLKSEEAIQKMQERRETMLSGVVNKTDV